MNTQDKIIGYRHGCAVRLITLESLDDNIISYLVQHKGKTHFFKTQEEAKLYIKETFNLDAERETK